MAYVLGIFLSLTFNSIIKDANRWRLNIIEEKTGKNRDFTISNEIYNYIKMYCLENNIKFNAKIFEYSKMYYSETTKNS